MVAVKKILLFLLLSSGVYAQTLFAPEQYLSYPVGSRFTPHHRVIDYFDYLAEARPQNCAVIVYGLTYEGRPLKVYVFGSSANISNLEKIRTNHLGVMDGAAPTASDPAVVWLSYGVHGNEAASSEAAMLTAWYLLENQKRKGFLDNALVIMDPSINPDGRERYVQWINEVSGVFPNPLTYTSEHNEPWPGGRFNHYLFDLNRDWAWQTQIESRQRIKLYQLWMPHIHVDFHEMGINDPYFFAPVPEPVHKDITNYQRAFQQTVGDNIARYFDQNGWLYFTAESYDLFYPSYGDTYPTMNGAIGFTFEQGGSGRASVGVIQENGDTLTLADRALHHFTSGIATVEAAVVNKETLIQNFYRFFNEPKNLTYRSFLVKSDETPDAMRAFKELLGANGIRFFPADAGTSISGFEYSSGKTIKYTAKTGDIVIPVDQTNGRLAHILLEPSPVLSDSLTYDATAWSLIYNFQLDGIASNSAITYSTANDDLTINNQVTTQAYAYLIRHNGLGAFRLISDLLKSDFRVRFNKKAITYGEEVFEPGSMIITRADNGNFPDFHQQMSSLANKHQQRLYAVSGGQPDDGPSLGSEWVQLIDKPEVLLIRGDGASATDFGATWYFLDQDLNYPNHIINSDQIASIDLKGITHIILPSFRAPDDRVKEKLMSWVRNGGTLIASEYTNSWLSEVDGVELNYESSAEDSSSKRYEDEYRSRLSENVPGSIFRVSVDNSHPVFYGIDNEFYLFKSSSYVFRNENEKLCNNPEPVSGFVGNAVKMQDTDNLVLALDNGRGRIISFTDDPLFRCFWYGSKIVFCNSLFFDF